MDCPFCGKEMKAGGIPSGRSAVYWQENSEEIDAPREKVILSKNPVWGIEEAEAFYCPDCRRIIVPVPEIETTGQKLKKKLDQVRSEIEKTRESWQQQKAEQKVEQTKGQGPVGVVTMKLVLASKNKKKLVEMNEILSHLGIEVCSEAEAGVDVEVEETGTTFEENSLLKARAVMEASGLPAIADDSGLCVDALNGAPGVYSARYGGEGLDDTGRCRLLLENMKGQMPRTAKFVSVITCCFPSGDVLTARGECPGTIAFAPQGEGGFGYDPVFFVPPLKKTFAQLTAEEKNAISHRGKALEVFQVKLKEYLGQ